MPQYLITNYLPMGHPLRTVGHTLENNPPPNYVRHHSIVHSDGDGSYWVVMPALPNLQLGTLELYFDNNGDAWINHVVVPNAYQRMGVATKMVRRAIQDYGHVYASNSPFDPGGEDDTRHLSMEGAALVTGLITAGIMQQNWLRPPII